MNGTLRLWALGPDQARAPFGAAPELAGRLRQVTTTQFPARLPKPAKFGPLRRRVVPPLATGQPGLPDAEALLAGRFVAPDRLEPAWRLLAAWWHTLAERDLEVSWDDGDLDRVDFELGRAGVPAAQGVRGLMRRRLDLPLRLPAGRTVGWASAAEAQAILAAWQAHWDELEACQAALMPIAAFLEAVTTDVVASYQQ
jgi:hypothetical protein